MKREEMPSLNHVFELFSQGETPDLWQVLAALNEISDQNTGARAPTDCLFPDEPRCKSCNL